MDSDEQLRFVRWKEHINKQCGDNKEDILLYLWNLYGSLLAEITEINKQNRTYNFLKNGKNV